MEIWRWSQRAATWKNTCGHSRETLTPTISSNRWRSLSESEAASCPTSDWWLWIIVGEVQRFKGKLEQFKFLDIGLQIEYFSGQLVWRLLQPVFKWTVADENVFLIIMEDHSCTMLSLLKEWNKHKPVHWSVLHCQSNVSSTNWLEHKKDGCILQGQPVCQNSHLLKLQILKCFRLILNVSVDAGAMTARS